MCLACWSTEVVYLEVDRALGIWRLAGSLLSLQRASMNQVLKGCMLGSPNAWRIEGVAQ